ncbi:signal recognition particle-docking protein FtsY, partial [Escherichia coli]|nr:signal recognition particle-docking protein FtsY [Escherichia coli]
SDVSIETSTYLVEGLRGAAKRGEVPTDGDIAQFLQREISILLGGGTHPLTTNPGGITVWLFVGVNGVGKTTSVGKLAHRLAKQGHKPLLVAADTFRAAAVEQLQEWGKRAGVPVIAQQAGADPAAVVFDGLHAAKARGCNYVLI